MSLKYFLKPFAQKIIKEDRIEMITQLLSIAQDMCSSVRINQATQSQASGKDYHIDTEMACGGVRRTLERKALFVVPMG